MSRYKIHLHYVSHDLFHFFYHVPVAVLEVGDGVFEVLSTSGDTHLGGDDFDKVYIVYTPSVPYHATYVN